MARQFGPGGSDTTFAYRVESYVGLVAGSEHATVVTDAAAGGSGDVRVHHYDGAGRLVAMTNPAGSTLRRGYGDADLVASVTSRSGVTTVVDRYGEGVHEGLVRSQSSPEGSVAYVYDDLDRVVSKTTTGGWSCPQGTLIAARQRLSK